MRDKSLVAYATPASPKSTKPAHMSSSRGRSTSRDRQGAVNVASPLVGGVDQYRDSHGAVPYAVPYFAMEYIPNAKLITTYADEKKLGTRQRMELFAKVCDAIHHGHQKGIIHRDRLPFTRIVKGEGAVNSRPGM